MLEALLVLIVSGLASPAWGPITGTVCAVTFYSTALTDEQMTRIFNSLDLKQECDSD